MTKLISLTTICAALLAASLLLSGTAHADGPTVTTALGFEFASGKYGTATRTDSIYAPLTLAVLPTERLGFSLEIPFLYQSSSAVNSGLFTGSGGTMHMARQLSSMSGSGMTGGSPVSSSTAANQSQPESGLGDIIARASYVLVPEGDLKPRIRPYFQIKFPTADAGKSLGTGTFAEGPVVEISKRLGDWYSFAEAGYIFQGSSSRLALKNYFSYDAGFGYAIADKYMPMLMVKGSTAPVAGSTDLLEVRLKLKYMAAAHTGLEGYAAKGMTTNSPDYGCGLAVFHDF